MTDNDDPLSSPFFQAVADLAFDSVMVTRTTQAQAYSEIVYVNSRFTELTGYEAEEVIGQTPGILQGPATDKSVTDRLAEQLRNGHTFHGQTVNYRKDGTAFDIEWKVTPVFSDSQASYYLAVQRDVTAR